MGDTPATTGLYVTTADLRQVIGASQAEYSNAVLDKVCEATSRAIDKMAQRRFWLSSAPTARTYTAIGRTMVSIDDAASITSVVSDGTTITDYLAEPLNAAAKDEPVKWLTARGVAFSPDLGAITVTATWGWPEVPSQVSEMALILASKLNKRASEAPFGVVNTGGLDGTAVRIAREDPDVQLLLRPLIRSFPAVA